MSENVVNEKKIHVIIFREFLKTQNTAFEKVPF